MQSLRPLAARQKCLYIRRQRSFAGPKASCLSNTSNDLPAESSRSRQTWHLLRRSGRKLAWRADLRRARRYQKIAPQGRKRLQIREIGARLVLNRKRQRQFLEAGVITAVLGPQIDGSKVYLFKAAQADEILDDFAKQLIGTAASPSRTRTFAEVLKSQKLRQIPLKSLIDAIRRGRLRPVGRRDDKCGLYAFRFGRQASILVLRELEAAHAAEAGGACQLLPPRRNFASPSGPNPNSR